MQVTFICLNKILKGTAPWKKNENVQSCLFNIKM